MVRSPARAPAATVGPGRPAGDHSLAARAGRERPAPPAPPRRAAARCAATAPDPAPPPPPRGPGLPPTRVAPAPRWWAGASEPWQSRWLAARGGQPPPAGRSARQWTALLPVT